MATTPTHICRSCGQFAGALGKSCSYCGSRDLVDRDSAIGQETLGAVRKKMIADQGSMDSVSEKYRKPALDMPKGANFTAPPLTRRASLPCQTCGQGVLVKRKKYRLSTPVVVIGYILLIPSVLGMLFGVFGILMTGSTVTQTSSQVSASIEREARKELEAQAIPEQIITEIITSKPISDAEMSSLNPQQVSTIEATKLSFSSRKTGAGAGSVIAGGILGSFFIVVIVMSFIGGLLGWLLIMKRKVLQCAYCEAVVAAS